MPWTNVGVKLGNSFVSRWFPFDYNSSPSSIAGLPLLLRTDSQIGLML